MERIVPKNWQETTLGAVCNLFTGNSINETIKRNKYTNLKEGYNYIATKDISFTSEIDYENGVKIPYGEVNFRIAPPNTPLLCIEGGSAGRKIGLTSQSVCFVNKLCAFTKKTDSLSTNFLYYYLQSPQFKKIFYDKQTGLIGGVSVGKLKSLKLNIPEFSEQERIAKKLDGAIYKIDCMKANAEFTLSATKDLFESELKQLMGEHASWEKTTVEGACKKISAGGDKPSHFSKFKTEECGVPIYSNGIENNGLYGYTDIPAITEPSLTISARGTIGFVCKRYEPYFPIVRLITVIPKEDILLDFMLCVLRFIVPKGTGASIPQLTVPVLKKNMIFYPNIEEQKKIIEKLSNLEEKLSHVKELCNKKIKLLDDLKQSILKQAFAGEL